MVVETENRQHREQHDAFEAAKLANLEKLRKKWISHALFLVLGRGGPLLSLGQYDAELERFNMSLSSGMFDLRWIGELSMNPAEAQELAGNAEDRRMNKNLAAFLHIREDKLIDVKLMDINHPDRELSIRFSEMPSIDPVEMGNRMWTAAAKEKNAAEAFKTYYTVYPDGAIRGRSTSGMLP